MKAYYDDYDSNTLTHMTEDELRDIYLALNEQMQELIDQMILVREELEGRGLTV